MCHALDLIELSLFTQHYRVVNMRAPTTSPAVARVSRPYSWCTLASCVHNCPSMMFRTCCCLRPKC